MAQDGGSDTQSTYSARGAKLLPSSRQLLIATSLRSRALVFLRLQRLPTMLCDDRKPNASPALIALCWTSQMGAGGFDRWIEVGRRSWSALSRGLQVGYCKRSAHRSWPQLRQGGWGLSGAWCRSSQINCRLGMIDCNHEDAIGLERIATVARPYEDRRMWCDFIKREPM